PLELEAVPRLRLGEAGLGGPGQPLERARIDGRHPIDAGSDVHGPLGQEKMVVKTGFDRDRMSRGYPVDRALDLPVVRSVAASGRRVVAAAHFGDLAGGGVLREARAAHDIAVAKPYHAAGKEA